VSDDDQVIVVAANACVWFAAKRGVPQLVPQID